MNNQRLRDYIDSDEWDYVVADLESARDAATSADPDDSARVRNALIRYQMMRDWVQILLDRANENEVDDDE